MPRPPPSRRRWAAGPSSGGRRSVRAGAAPGGPPQRSRRRGHGRTPRPGGAVPRPRESPGIVAVRVMGELFITLGVVMILFVLYQLWWTNVAADAYASGSAKTLEKQWNPGGSG